MQAFGIDIGGTGIKGAPVDVAAGKLLADRKKIETPHPALPDAVAAVVHDIVSSFDWSGPIGITFPGVVTDGVTQTAANLDPAWFGLDARDLFAKAAGNPVQVINDADAAGVAEMTFGAGVNVKGTVLMLTFGTGIGSALFVDGRLVPNTEFGHLQVAGREAELRASGRARVDQNLSWDAWAEQLNLVLKEMHALLWPDLIVLCGGITEEPEKFLDKLHCEARLCVGTMRSEAGIVGAALATMVVSSNRA